MSLATITDLLDTPAVRGRAVGCFDVFSPECVGPIVAAAESEELPVVLAIDEATGRAAGFDLLALAALARARTALVPVAVHLNHARRLETVLDALDHGFTSVMFDGSELPFADNLALTRKAAQLAHRVGADIEGQLGELDAADLEEMSSLPLEECVKRFVQETAVDLLAFDLPRCGANDAAEAELALVRRVLCRPAGLVLHGASRMVSDALDQAIGLGVRKVNVHTELHQAFRAGLAEGLAAAGSGARGVLDCARDHVERFARRQMRLYAGRSGS